MSDDFCQYCYDLGLRYPGDGKPWGHAISCPKAPPQEPTEVDKLRAETAQLRADLDKARAERDDWFGAAITACALLAPVVKGPGLVDAVTQLIAERDTLQAENERLMAALAGVLKHLSANECYLDHSGACQMHFLENPCSVAVARAAINSARKAGQ